MPTPHQGCQGQVWLWLLKRSPHRLLDGLQPRVPPGGAHSHLASLPTQPVRSSVLGGRPRARPGASSHLHGLLEQVGPGLHPVLDALQLCLVLSKALSLLAPAER